MNFFPFHINDFAQAAGHLSFVEEGAYQRMIRKYYADESPLPGDVKTVQRLVGARSAAERKAVETVLREFFTLRDNFWHQSRCDEEIERYLGKKVGADQKRENTAERQRRHRDRRRKLFDELREYDIVPAYETSTTELEAILSRVTSASLGSPVTRDATATHTPVTSNHTKEEGGVSLARDLVVQASIELRKRGVRVTPSNPDLIAATSEGVTVTHLCDLAEANPGKPIGYLLAIGRREHAEGAKQLQPGTTHANRTPSRKLSAVEQIEQAIAERKRREVADAGEALADGPG